MTIDLFRLKGRISRQRYLLTGIILFALKLVIDECVSNLVFHRSWQLSNYYSLGTILQVNAPSSTDSRYYLVMLFCATPFIWIGLAMSGRRLKDANLPLPLAILFVFRPFNWLLIATLCILRRNTVPVNQDYSAWSLERIISKDIFARGCQALFTSIIVGVVMVYLACRAIGTYGSSLFIGVPIVMGYAIGWIDSYHDCDYVRSAKLAALAPLIVGTVIIAIALEGLICLIMAAPIAYAFVFVGLLVGIWTSHSSNLGRSIYLSCSPIVTLPLLVIWEAANLPTPPLLHVRSEVIVNAPIQTVWHNVISFPTIPPPHDLLFKSGIAYPIDAVIVGHGPGAVRHCDFSTGTFVEPITTWNQPKLLQFSVQKQPEPMKELSPYRIDPPHLRGYLKCERGEFRLIPLSGGRTEIIGTTWYRDNIWPQEYWSLYSNAIIHRIHMRVLNHIKAISEREAREKFCKHELRRRVNFYR